VALYKEEAKVLEKEEETNYLVLAEKEEDEDNKD
jgi:hypothetical protein